jgi:hypothetical protein
MGEPVESARPPLNSRGTTRVRNSKPTQAASLRGATPQGINFHSKNVAAEKIAAELV